MKITFAEGIVITKALYEYKERWESCHETRLDEEDENGRLWKFFEEKLTEDERNEHNAMKKLLSKFTNAEL